MSTIVVTIRTAENLIQQAGVTVNFDESSWLATSDPKGLLFRPSGTLGTLVPNLVALVSSSGQPVVHLEGMHAKTVAKGAKGDGLLFGATGFKFTVGWEVIQLA